MMISVTRVLPGGEEGVEEHKELESYLWVRSVGDGVAGGGPAAGAGAWRRWWRRAAVLRRGWASGGGLGTFSVPRGTHSGARLERRWSGGRGRRGVGAPGEDSMAAGSGGADLAREKLG